MPTLQFKGKNIIWNHHLSVPYHTLEEIAKLHFQPDKSNGNIIIEGDNMLALKALLPMYAGKVKVVCIDPPYNTGNEGWVYNDSVNSPLIKDWLGKEVGKDDLTRHDKWLCMMTPRLRLLRELLADDGAIFVCIDDNEQHYLRMLLDEIFGSDNFVANIEWQKKYAASNDAVGIPAMHDHILVYQKTDSFNRNLLPRTEDVDKPYKFDNKDGKGLWRSDNLLVKSFSEASVFPINNPLTGKEYSPPKGKCWRGSKETVEKWLKEGRIFFGKDGRGAPQLKRYLNEVQQGVVPTTWWPFDLAGHNDAAKKEIESIFDKKVPFDTPKPLKLISLILQISTQQDSLILDSFSGSGTTGHAVMDLNKEDGGNRKFILVQMAESTEKEPKKNICKDITRERIKRAIEKYGYDSGFQYLRVGQALDAETLLEGNLPDYKTLAKYVYYLCTGENLKISPDPSLPKRGSKIPSLKKGDAGGFSDKNISAESQISEKKFFVGTFGKQAIYLIYKQDYDALTKMALNLEFAEKIIADQPDKKRIVYAPACFLDEEYMEEKQIEFVSIPYNMFQRKT